MPAAKSKPAVSTLTAIQKYAVAKVFDTDKMSKDGTRDALKPGAYEIDMTVRVHGTLKVGEDTEAFERYDVPLDAALLRILQGVMETEDIVKALPKALRTVHDYGADKRKALTALAGITPICDAFKAKVNEEKGKVGRAGSVSTTLFVDPA